LPWLFAAGLAGALLIGASGAIAALGDTLFPVDSLAEGIANDFAAASHLFVQLRVFHPIIAVVVGAYTVALGWFAAQQRPGRATWLAAVALTALFAAQFVVGLVNLVLLAPVAMQLIHLLLADLVWIAMVISATVALAAERQPVLQMSRIEA
ncbi:MAG: COX15/CtaA family protein, partial [Roseiflexaceae bacterium]|nr:COX15/CtaA family protein [Roseiflexaceae bacterium]